MKSLYFFLLILFSFLPKNLLAYEYKLSIGAIFKNEAPYLKEWIDYHKMVGVEHFWLYNDDSPDNWQEVLKPYIEEGLVEVIDWSYHPNSHIGYYQISAYKDVIAKARGVSEWLALIDIDEFILPMQEASITECIKKHYSTAGAIFANWKNFGTSKVYLSLEDSILFNLSLCTNRTDGPNANGKSIFKPELANLENYWCLHHTPLCNNQFYFDGDGTPIKPKGVDWAFDGKHHAKFIRINHYYFKDENFFKNIKLPRMQYFCYNLQTVEQQYKDYNTSKDVFMMDFIRKKHPKAYETFWKAKDPRHKK